MRLNELIPVFTEFIDDQIEPRKLYISKEYGSAIHLCACGCGHKTVTPFRDKPSDDGMYWGLTDNNGIVTLNGSIGNYRVPCQSHYNIEANKVIWHSK